MNYLSYTYTLRGCVVILLLLALNACSGSTERHVQDVANDFWQALIINDMEAAKNAVTWESTQYLPLFQSQLFKVQRFELGELTTRQDSAEIATLLYTGQKGTINVPLRTVLVNQQGTWLVDVPQTTSSMVGGVMETVVNQLEHFMQEGLTGIDETLSQSIDEHSDALKQSFERFKKELEHSLQPPKLPKDNLNNPDSFPI